MRRLINLIALTALAGCVQSTEKPLEIYQVISHDAVSGQWVVDQIDNVDKTRVRYTLTCDFQTRDSEKPVNDPDSCDLRVGDAFSPNRFHERKSEFIDVWLMSADRMAIIRGDSADRVSQQFKVNSAHVLKYGDGP